MQRSGSSEVNRRLIDSGSLQMGSSKARAEVFGELLEGHQKICRCSHGSGMRNGEKKTPSIGNVRVI